MTTDGVSETYECPFGGSNLGAFFDRNAASAISFGMVDMNMLEANRYDQGVAHEVSELFVAGLIALRDQSDVPMAIQGKTNPRMVEAHNMAIPAVLENGGIYQFGIKFGQLGKIKFNPFDILNIIQ